MNNRAPDSPTPDNHEIDDRGFAAGRALRQPAPEHGLAKVRSSYRRRRIVPAATLGIMSVVAIGGVITILNQRSQPSLGSPTGNTVPTDVSTTTTVGTTTNPPTTAPQASNVVTPTSVQTPVVSSTTAAPVPVAPATPPPSSAPTTLAPSPSAPSTTVKPNSLLVLYSGPYFVGHWDGNRFVYSSTDVSVPPNLVGNTLHLVGEGGATYDGKAVDCGGSDLIRLWPNVPEGGTRYLHSEGAPFTQKQINDDRGLTEMNAALTEMGLDVGRADSLGAPLSANGGVDRVVWYKNGADFVIWLATFNSSTGKFNTIEGDPNPQFNDNVDGNIPDDVFVDLDNDGNLESTVGAGDSVSMIEWATGTTVWGTGAQWAYDASTCQS